MSLLPKAFLCAATLLASPIFSAEKIEPTAKPEVPTGKALSESERAEFLARRTSGNIAPGSFSSIASLLYAVSEVSIDASAETAKVRVQVPFAGGYAPTWRELFDALGRATQTNWSYNADKRSWIFAAPASALPYTLKLASNWTQEDQGGFLMCKPALAPVGMDIYYMGTYSFEKNAEKSLRRIRDEVAMTFASRLNKDVDSGDMKKVNIDGSEALYFETPTPRPGVTWRQWVLVKNGLALAIVSAIDAANEKAILPDIEAMVKTLHVQRP